MSSEVGLRTGVFFIATLLLIIQFVPYGRAHWNPGVRIEPLWDCAQTRQMVRRACFDCHSNETVWPAYANVAPMSWLIQRDVYKGRGVLNFSEWQRPQQKSMEVAESIRQQRMPPTLYALLHSQATLNGNEKTAVIKGLEATISGERLNDTWPLSTCSLPAKE